MIGNAVRVMRIATGVERDEMREPPAKRVEIASKGDVVRAEKLSSKHRKEIASSKSPVSSMCWPLATLDVLSMTECGKL